MINKIQIIKELNGRYKGEAWLKGHICASASSVSKTNVIRSLNESIANYEKLKGITLPRMGASGRTVLFSFNNGETKVTEYTDTLEQAVEKSQDIAKQEETPTACKPQIAKRQPFTPYGLNGYLVDNKGNIRLMLDRKASARTIVLTAEMFATLAEMVKKTQEQKGRE